MQAESDKLNRSLRDLLALDRTRLANQRTLLAFTVTAMHVGGLALTFYKLPEFAQLKFMTLPLAIVAFVIFILGILSFLRVRRDVDGAYGQP